MNYIIQVRNGSEKWIIYGYRASLLMSHDDAEAAIRREKWDEARVRHHRQTVHHVRRSELEDLAGVA